MSVQLSFIDIHRVHQITFSNPVDIIDDDIHFTFIRIATYGWKNGSHFRVKNLRSDRALAYVNKLHAGGWIDDDVYSAIYITVDHLLERYKEELLSEQAEVYNPLFVHSHLG